jgi:hypothetical protein
MIGAAGLMPSINVSSQSLVGNNLTISEVMSEGPGWVVIHNNLQGKPVE